MLHTQDEAEFHLYHTCLARGLSLCNFSLKNKVCSYSEYLRCFSVKYKKYSSRTENFKLHLLVRQPKLRVPVLGNSNMCHLYVISSLEEKIM